MTISMSDYYMGRDLRFKEELTDAHRMNAEMTVAKANTLLERFGEERHVVSGWRPALINNATRGASPTSKHMLCQAVDLEDHNKGLMNWCLNNPDILAEIGLWVEDTRDTPTWVHVQTVPPNSGHRFFRA